MSFKKIYHFFSNSDQVYIAFDAMMLVDLYPIRTGIILGALKRTKKTNTLQSNKVVRKFEVL